MKNDIPLGHIRGIRVGLSWSALLIAGFYVYILATYQFPREAWGLASSAYWFAGIVGAAAFFASLFVHEMSHALMARRQGVGVKGITLWLLGGYAELESEPRTSGAQFLIAVVGPASNLVLGAIFWTAHRQVAGSPDVFTGGYGTESLVAVTLGWLAFVNVLLGVFNLLPAAPLDGGQLFSAAIWAVTGRRSAGRRWAAYAGVALGALGAGYGLVSMQSNDSMNGIWFMFIGWWIVSVALADLRRTGVENTLSTMTAGDAMIPNPPIVPDALTIDRAIGPAWSGVVPAAVCAQAPDGRITGVLTAAQLSNIDPTSRATIPLAQLAFPIDRVAIAATDEPLSALLDRLRGNAVGRVLILERDGRVAGTVGIAELDAAARRRPRAVPATR